MGGHLPGLAQVFSELQSLPKPSLRTKNAAAAGSPLSGIQPIRLKVNYCPGAGLAVAEGTMEFMLMAVLFSPPSTVERRPTAVFWFPLWTLAFVPLAVLASPLRIAE